jgi:ABC-2 type transport system permease protein
MTGAISSELLKLRTVRATWGLLAAALAVTGLMLALQVVNAGRAGAASFGTAQAAVDVLRSGGTTALVALVLGILTITSEHRYSTLPTTLLATPLRRRVIIAKMVAAGIAGLVIAALVVLLSAATGAATGALTAATVNAAVLQTVAGVMAVIPLYALVGVGFGLIVRNQTLAVTSALLWLLVGETIIGSLGLGWLVPWTPGGASRAIGQDAQLVGALPPWAGVVLLIGYATAFAAVGGWRLARRDVG